VVTTAEYYEVQEKMHWLCFHLEFEHSGDPDSPCNDPDCPWWRIEFFRKKLESLGCDPKQVLSDALNEHWLS